MSKQSISNNQENEMGVALCKSIGTKNPVDIQTFIEETLNLFIPPGFGFDYYWMEHWENRGEELWRSWFQDAFSWPEARAIGLLTISAMSATPHWTSLGNRERRRKWTQFVQRQLRKIYEADAKIPRQRTPEWYLRRQNMITASDVYKVLKSPNDWRGCLRGKIKGLAAYLRSVERGVDDEADEVRGNAPALDWGVCFEPVVTEQIYPAMRDGCEIGEFGCLEHPRVPGLGASPDGIVVAGPAKQVGRMLEIKCPMTRKHDDYKIKQEQWVQMQIQMEVCDLEECDFLEVWFKERGAEEWEADTESEQKGVAYRVASPTGSSWQHDREAIPEGALITEKRQWVVEQLSCRLVKRNREWFSSVRDDIEEFIQELHSIQKQGDVSVEAIEEAEEEGRAVNGGGGGGKRAMKAKSGGGMLKGFSFRKVGGE